MKLSFQFSAVVVLLCTILPALADSHVKTVHCRDTAASGAGARPAAGSLASNNVKAASAAPAAQAVKAAPAANAAPAVKAAVGGKVCNIVDYGAKGSADIGPAITKAFQQCVMAGGSANKVLLIPQGNWVLSSHVRLDKGTDYTFQWDGQVTLPHDESIGGGAMVTFGYSQRMLLKGRGKFIGGGVNWRANGLNNNRPRLINFFKCADSEATGVHLDDSPMFFLGLSQCTGMKVHDMVFSSPPPYKGSTDAVDVSCTNCKIWNLDITNGDDSVVMKSPAHNVEVRNVTIRHGYGIGIGTAGKNGVFDISNIYASDIHLIDATAGQYTKSYPSATGVIRNFTMENVTLKNVAKPIAIDPFWGGGSMDTPESGVGPSKLIIQDFTFRHWRGTGDATTRPTIFLNGSPAAPMKNMVFEDVVLGKEGNRKPEIKILNACGSGLAQLKSCGGGSNKRSFRA
ncbi:uncharacterized protein PFL1_04550 [Pseudozyma flocculosa PF-1]|uniref:Glycoside hydrolase family 28 protein n=2 Tax=Pseudozyma flocculosa TaxID=84751 RepID=A0A5C3FBM5_9BASI|nr:uncharacterized protein PFL1_04550 [Pseudozyma flocculosa PF-1]EPQ27805.1 hypothetical protein PFL1_04550 [Pseudozyma flocculosa PF-1]SPO41067.1 uncharacterized protein PSFLO_06549 [Pseudozyma flocculosa]